MNRSLVFGVITILLWGSLATFGTLLIHLPPFFTLGVCFFLGGILGLTKPHELFPGKRIFLWGVGGYFGYHFFLFYAFRFAPQVEANLINYLWPIIMVFLTPVFFPGENLRWFHFVGAFLSLLGCVFLVSDKVGGQTADLRGYVLAAFAAITWPIYSLGKKKFPETSLRAISGFCLGSSALCFLAHVFLEPSAHVEFTDAWKLACMGLGPFGIAFYTWDLALKSGNPRTLGALAYLTPVISTAGLMIFTHQEIGPSTLVAIVLILGGACTGLLDFHLKKGPAEG